MSDQRNLDPDNDQQIRDDTVYSPSSETETEVKQDEPPTAPVDDDIDASAVKTAPGTGGPDDVGEVEVDPADIHLPQGDGGPA
ncbi:hypothetical protein GCM10011490_11930 [Pseudoclavibacter endophyticus]|uniref:Uncharacterized protein n=1 Tax=Pseudoclavibacter endophyticus TaxID=1778590 RepID=A0A6H9WMV1_9MICO|nr:hypothetical protein [Pseudoclavibacter endophyticus]KAB1649388.1 hypothetical protein F8O04_03725 [Pseudoclavibacter endophyticus]GGA63027.1 hypothetical protein GCM10011490_11930 [Pseudoclavibacter endophyticus]